MAIPDFQSILLPLLKATASREELSSAESYKLMAEHFQLSEAEVENPMPSGRGSTFRNRVAWAKQYLMFAQLVEPTRRGVSRVTELGREWSRKRTAPLKSLLTRICGLKSGAQEALRADETGRS
jgi:restriction system protein